jgi:hypothetical protein
MDTTNYIYKGQSPLSKCLIIGALYRDNYSTFTIDASWPDASAVAFATLKDTDHTVVLHNCTLADKTITLKVGIKPDPHRLVTEQLGVKSAIQYMLNASGQKNGMYKEWRDGALVTDARYAADVRYGAP